MIVLAHGVGSRADLPVPLALALYGAGLAVVVSFLGLLLLWRRHKLRGDASGRPLPRLVQTVVDSPVTKAAARAVALLLILVVMGVALAGPPSPKDNLAPYALYVTLWVGLIPASLLLGPFWAYLDPLRTLHAGLARTTGPAPAEERLPALGYWPAAGSLLVCVWLELVLPGRAEPRAVGVFLVVYGVVQLIAACGSAPAGTPVGTLRGLQHLDRRLSPFGRREDGRLVVRSPLDGVDVLRTERGPTAVVLVPRRLHRLSSATRWAGWSRAAPCTRPAAARRRPSRGPTWCATPSRSARRTWAPRSSEPCTAWPTRWRGCRRAARWRRCSVSAASASRTCAAGRWRGRLARPGPRHG